MSVFKYVMYLRAILLIELFTGLMTYNLMCLFCWILLRTVQIVFNTQLTVCTVSLDLLLCSDDDFFFIIFIVYNSLHLFNYRLFYYLIFIIIFLCLIVVVCLFGTNDLIFKSLGIFYSLRLCIFV